MLLKESEARKVTLSFRSKKQTLIMSPESDICFRMQECLCEENPTTTITTAAAAAATTYFLVKQTNDDRFLQNNLSANLSAGDRAVSRTLSVAPTPEPVVAQKS